MMRTEFKGGMESAVHGFSSTIGPILLFVGFFGSQSLAAAFWASLVSATLIPAFAMLLKTHPAIHASTRTASLSAYLALILQLSLASQGATQQSTLPSAGQLLTGLAAGSLLFALASLLVMLAGIFKLGHIFKMIPGTVTAGISNSIAALLVWLAIKQVMHSHGYAVLTVLAMLLSFVAWKFLQRRLSFLKAIPNLLPAVLLGLLVSHLVEPRLAGASAEAGYDLAWAGLGLWPSLLDQSQLGNLLLLGLPGTLTLALVMILETITTHKTMESRFGLRIHANRELVVLGSANLVSAMLGGVPSTGSPLRSLASWYAGGRGKQATLVALTVTGLALVLLGPWLLALPAGVMAGLFLMQVPIMIDPAFQTRFLGMLRSRSVKSQGASDLGFWISFVITLAGIFGNLIWACFLGIGLSCLAVLRRVSGSLTSKWTYLDQHRSRRIRSLSEIRALEQSAQAVGVLRLTGHLFFGNSTRLAELTDELHPQASVALVDVSQVHDVDTSGTSALIFLIQALHERNLMVILTGETLTPCQDLRLALATLPKLVRCVDLDRGLENAEAWVLKNNPAAATSLPLVLAAGNLLLAGIKGEKLRHVLQLGAPRQLAEGDVLFQKNEAADGIWLLEEGLVSIISDQANSTRLATFGPGQFVGEMGFVDGNPRSASARADTALRALWLNNQSLTTLAAQHPEAALKMTQNIARELSYRVRYASDLLSDNSARARSGWKKGDSLFATSRF